MNLFTITVWTTAILPLFGHCFCLWQIRKKARNNLRNSAIFGAGLGLLIVAANLADLVMVHVLHVQNGPFAVLSIALPITAAILSIFAIILMRRSADFDVQSIGIPSTILSLFSMASVVALGGMTIAG